MTEIFSAALLVAMAVAAAADDAQTRDSIAAIKKVDREGNGHAEAVAAARQLQQLDAAALPEVLRAFNGANPLAANWLRGVVETITDRTIQAGQPLPVAELRVLMDDRSNDSRARRLAYECLFKVDPSIQTIIPQMLDDPAAAFRRDAVEYWLAEAAKQKEAGDAAAAKETYQRALSGAYDDDQVRTITAALKELGQEVDLQKHYGFLTRWQIIGPFDSTGGKGFAAEYPPEKAIDYSAELQGKEGAVRWQELATADPYGVVDIAKDVAPHKGAAMYLATEFQSPTEQPAQLRIGTPNAWKVWVNGEYLFGREEYHRGMEIDQYQVDAKLKPGANVILLKICQNEQTDDWAQSYRFQLRVCDASGSALPQQSESTAARQSE